jgi:hypothetical protein
MKKTSMKPIFILSLPRSGSTLLQRVLATSNEICTVAESWVLLPFAYSLRENGVYTEYSHRDAHGALYDFIEELPNGRKDYLAAVGTAIVELYQKINRDNALYFLDKTPRYALIAEDIIDIFPEGKFIYLWRNPLAIIASMIETWEHGRWNVFRYKIDLFDGMAQLIDSYQSHPEKVLAIKYEAFLQSPENELARIEDYLGLKFGPAVLKNFLQVTFKGRMGDATGINSYHELNTSPIEKWKTVINNPLRKMWCRQYLRWLGAQRLGVIGYDLDHLLSEIDSSPTCMTGMLKDIIMTCYGVLYCTLEAVISKHKLQQFPDWRSIKHHS